MSRVDLMSANRCHAKAKQTGVQCYNRALTGQRVCWIHGGRSPQALAKAEDRMRALVHPAITALAQLIADNDLAAARYVLDYAGFKAAEKVQQEGTQTLEIVFDRHPTPPALGVNSATPPT